MAAYPVLRQSAHLFQTCGSRTTRTFLPKSPPVFGTSILKQCSASSEGFSVTRQLSATASAVNSGKKQSHNIKDVISVNVNIHDYILSNTREPEILSQLRLETSSMIGKEMQVSPEQGSFLAMLVQVMGATRCIEVGIYTGYSSISTALALPPHGKLVACERVPHTLEVAKRYYELAGVADKVDVRLGMAAETLTSMIEDGEAGSYDFAFLDADKRSYRDYYELLLSLLRPGGLLVIDNVLWHGKVADPQETDVRTEYLRGFNEFVFSDKRVTTSMVPIGDGMTLCRKS